MKGNGSECWQESSFQFQYNSLRNDKLILKLPKSEKAGIYIIIKVPHGWGEIEEPKRDCYYRAAAAAVENREVEGSDGGWGHPQLQESRKKHET